MSFVLADTPHGSVPRMPERALAAGSSFLQGALLTVNGSGQYAECGADPALIAAVAATPCGTDATGFNILGKKEFPPGYMQGINVDPEYRFRAKYIGTLPAADGGSYGVVKDADGLWKVDFTDTTATRVKLVGRLTNSPENVAQVIVSFLAANVQPN
jgi:hypothetical protein